MLNEERRKFEPICLSDMRVRTTRCSTPPFQAIFVLRLLRIPAEQECTALQKISINLAPVEPVWLTASCSIPLALALYQKQIVQCAAWILFVVSVHFVIEAEKGRFYCV